MSSARSRNKFCLSLDDSTRSTSSSTTYLNRWSEVVPPDAALTFAALWDPEEGMVTFSGAELLESESLSGIPTHVFDDDDYSQIISADQLTEECATASVNTATLATFQDAFKPFLRRTPSDSDLYHCTEAPRGHQTRASSTFDGLDVYSHDIPLKPKRSLQLSRMDLLDMDSFFRTPPVSGRLSLGFDTVLGSYRSDSENGSSTGARPTHLKSRFSTTTTSTSNYVDVKASNAFRNESVHITEISLVPERTLQNESLPPTPRTPRLLRKRRPCDSDATPTATSPRSRRSTLRRKATPKSYASSSSYSSSPSTSASTPSFPSSPSPRRTYPSTMRISSNVCTSDSEAFGEERSPRLVGSFRDPMTPTSTSTSTPPIITPSTVTASGNLKSSRLKLRFAFFPRRKRRQTSSDSLADGWVCIEITPVVDHDPS